MFAEIIATLKGYKNKLSKQLEAVNVTLDYLISLEQGDKTIQEEKQVEPDKPPPSAKKTVRGPYKKHAVKIVKADEPKHIKGLRGPRNKASQYKGVSRTKPRMDGKPLWRAQTYVNGKNVSLGQFDIEELAAAAYAEQTGDHAEAERLRGMVGIRKADMAEQAENNPDRAVKKVTVYVCAHCKLEWRSKPDRCPSCDSATFTTKLVAEDKV